MNEYGCLLEKHRQIGIESPTFMLTVVWGVTGFHVVKRFPKGGTFPASYYVNQIVPEIASWREGQRGRTNRRLIIDSGNARLHTTGSTLRGIEACGMVRAPHPSYSPDLAPSDCFRFGYRKSMLQGRYFETGDDVFATIMELAGAIDKTTLERVFPSGWKDWGNVLGPMVSLSEGMGVFEHVAIEILISCPNILYLNETRNCAKLQSTLSRPHRVRVQLSMCYCCSTGLRRSFHGVLAPFFADCRRGMTV
jgi:hypothetical protein